VLRGRIFACLLRTLTEQRTGKAERFPGTPAARVQDFIRRSASWTFAEYSSVAGVYAFEPERVLLRLTDNPPGCASSGALSYGGVGPLEHMLRNDHADFSRGRRVDGQHASGNYLNRQIGGFGTSEHFVCDDR